VLLWLFILSIVRFETNQFEIMSFFFSGEKGSATK